MTKVSAPYLYRKRGIYYLQKRIPKPLIPKYGRSILQRSLRTTNRADAVRLSSFIVSSLEREWQALLFDIPNTSASAFYHLTSSPIHPAHDTLRLSCSLEWQYRSYRYIPSSLACLKPLMPLRGL